MTRNISADEMQAIVQRYVAWRQGPGERQLVTGHKLHDKQGRVMGAAVR